MARTVAGTRQVVRNFGTCVSFNNTSSFIQNLNVSLTGTFTVLTWFKKLDSDFNWVLGHGSGSQKLGFFNTDVFWCRMVNAGSTVSADVGYKPSMNRKWNFLAAKRNSSDSISASLNGGSSVVAGTLSGTFTFTQIGKDNGATFYYGDLDETIVFNTELTDAQIQAFYYTGILPTTGLVARWKYDEGSGTALIDSSATQANGLINNGTYSTNVFMIPRSVAGTRTLVDTRYFMT